MHVLLKKVLAPIRREMDLRSDSRYFVSGSNSFITDLCGMLTERGIPRERIRTEGFDH